jgi:hypothetical protein
MNASPIDAVITWVDGSDPRHYARLSDYLASLGGPAPKAADPTRVHDAGELDWCVTSILRFAPFIRRIHILTAEQTPALIERLRGTAYADRVRVVDHRESFRGHEQHLPSFNSRAIITTLYRIPELAERYIFFNDDFVLLRPVVASDFFRDDSVVLRGEWQKQSQHRPMRRALMALRRLLDIDPATNPAARVRNVAAQEESARLAGFDQRYLRVQHLPFPQRRSTLQTFFEQHPQQLERNLRYRLRSGEQFKSELLSMLLEVRDGHAMFDNSLKTAQLKPSEQSLARVRSKIAAADADDRYAFACVQSLELAPPPARQQIVDWLSRRIGTLDALQRDVTAP